MKNCKECPYKVVTTHNIKFLTYVEKMNNNGVIKNKEHGCHMIDPKNIWKVQTEKTKCAGKCERN